MGNFSYCVLQVKDLFVELKVECNVVELDLIGKMGQTRVNVTKSSSEQINLFYLLLGMSE